MMPCRGCRVINVSSSAHLFGNIHVDDINLRKGYNNWKAYGQSKLANVMFTFELAKRLPQSAKVDTNALHPGVVSTELARWDLLRVQYHCATPTWLKHIFVQCIILLDFLCALLSIDKNVCTA
jgi:NAD(P)-dependent dehydrogenase (short-subunit alcohol dehydrogenase family)